MTSQAETIRETAGDQPAASGPPPRRRRVTSALVTAGLLVLLVGVLGYLIVLAQPFADASGGCGGG